MALNRFRFGRGSVPSAPFGGAQNGGAQSAPACAERRSFHDEDYGSGGGGGGGGIVGVEQG